MAKKPPARRRPGVPLWALAGILLPAGALVYLFVWSQTGDPFSTQTEIQRAAIRLEGAALDALDARKGNLCRAAAKRPFTPDRDGILTREAAAFLSRAIPFSFHPDAGGGVEVLVPLPPPEKIIQPLPGNDLENQRYRAFSESLDQQEFIRGDPGAAEKILDAMTGQFDQPGFQVRTVLLRAAFPKRWGRLEETGEDLVRLIGEIGPAAAPGPDHFPFAVSALLLLEGLPAAGTREKERLVAAMAQGAVPLNAFELRAVMERLPTLAESVKAGITRRIEALRLEDVLKEDPAFAAKLQEDRAFARVRDGRLWLGVGHKEPVEGAAGPADPGLASLLRPEELTGPESGFRIVLMEEGAPVPPAKGVRGLDPQVVRAFTAPAGIQGAVLKIVLADRSVFEQTVASRKTFITGVAVLLILAMLVLGFATFRAVRREVAAAKARTDVRAAASHELRTPRAASQVSAELLEDGRGADPLTRLRCMRLILSNGRRLSAMIENVLDVSRSDRGLPRFEVEEIDLKALLEDLCRDIRSVAEEEGFQVEVLIDPDLPAVRADPLALTRAVFNLCDNARKYSGEEKQIAIEGVPAEGGARISITDKGPGIKASEQEKVFERFHRGQKGKGGVSGAGLGLSLAREAVEGCGGRLELESVEGKGSTFSIFLPGLDLDILDKDQEKET